MLGVDALEVAAVPGEPAGGVLGGDGVRRPRLPLGDHGRDDRGAVLGGVEAADGSGVVQHSLLEVVDLVEVAPADQLEQVVDGDI